MIFFETQVQTCCPLVEVLLGIPIALWIKQTYLRLSDVVVESSCLLLSTFCSWTPCTCIPAVWEVRQLSKPQSVCSGYSFCGNSILLPHLRLAEPTWRAKLGNTSPWRPYLPLSLEQSSPVSLPWPTLPHPPPPAIEPPTFPSLPRGTGRKCFQNRKQRPSCRGFAQEADPSESLWIMSLGPSLPSARARTHTGFPSI